MNRCATLDAMPIGPWHRIAEDLRSTTGRVLELLPEDTDGWVEFHIFLDGEPFGSFGRPFSSDPEEQLAEIADVLREQTLDEEIWGGWPICPAHQTHPLDPRADAQLGAVWSCPLGSYVTRIGALLGPSGQSV
jgi:hypothetical protein